MPNTWNKNCDILMNPLGKPHFLLAPFLLPQYLSGKEEERDMKKMKSQEEGRWKCRGSVHLLGSLTDQPFFFFFLISGSRFSANTGFDGNEYQIHPKQLPGSAPFPGFLSSLIPWWFHPPGPFSQCHRVVPPHSSFNSCVHGQCGTKGDALTLCRSLQAYASLCTQAGQTPAWRNSTFCRE